MIGESELDEFLINNKIFLNIKLNRGISAFFYMYLKEALEKFIDNDIKEFILLRDKYDINRRSIWSKEIVLVINCSYLLRIQASGRNFKREEMKINIEEIEKKQFTEWCNQEINKILIKIERKKIVLNRFRKVLEMLTLSEKSNNKSIN